MGYSIASSPQRPVTGVFFVQYISMILIILTVIAGVLTRRTAVSSVEPILQMIEYPALVGSARPISEWTELQPIPQAYLQCVTENEWSPYREVLSEHDLTLAIELSVPSLQRGLAEVENIRGQLLSSAMESDAVLVSFSVQPYGAPPSMRLRWLKAPAVLGEQL